MIGIDPTVDFAVKTDDSEFSEATQAVQCECRE
jgi:hypothetical protein